MDSKVLTFADYVEETISSVVEDMYTSTEVRKVKHICNSKYITAIPKTLNLELVEVLVVLVEAEELVVIELATLQTLLAVVVQQKAIYL